MPKKPPDLANILPQADPEAERHRVVRVHRYSSAWLDALRKAQIDRALGRPAEDPPTEGRDPKEGDEYRTVAEFECPSWCRHPTFEGTQRPPAYEEDSEGLIRPSCRNILDTILVRDWKRNEQAQGATILDAVSWIGEQWMACLRHVTETKSEILLPDSWQFFTVARSLLPSAQRLLTPHGDVAVLDALESAASTLARAWESGKRAHMYWFLMPREAEDDVAALLSELRHLRARLWSSALAEAPDDAPIEKVSRETEAIRQTQRRPRGRNRPKVVDVIAGVAPESTVDACIAQLIAKRKGDLPTITELAVFLGWRYPGNFKRDKPELHAYAKRKLAERAAEIRASNAADLPFVIRTGTRHDVLGDDADGDSEAQIP